MLWALRELGPRLTKFKSPKWAPTNLKYARTRSQLISNPLTPTIEMTSWLAAALVPVYCLGSSAQPVCSACSARVGFDSAGCCSTNEARRPGELFGRHHALSLDWPRICTLEIILRKGLLSSTRRQDENWTSNRASSAADLCKSKTRVRIKTEHYYTNVSLQLSTRVINAPRYYTRCLDTPQSIQHPLHD